MLRLELKKLFSEVLIPAEYFLTLFEDELSKDTYVVGNVLIEKGKNCC